MKGLESYKKINIAYSNDFPNCDKAKHVEFGTIFYACNTTQDTSCTKEFLSNCSACAASFGTNKSICRICSSKNKSCFDIVIPFCCNLAKNTLGCKCKCPP